MTGRSSQLATQPSWKEEVNRRLAAHQTRKGLSVVEQGSEDQEQAGVSDRAAKAAARVAARFSSAPSYAEMQAAEARAALRDAQVATRAALEAQAVAQTALAELERIAEDEADQQQTSEVSIEEQRYVVEEQESRYSFHAPETAYQSHTAEAVMLEATEIEEAAHAPAPVMHEAMLPRTIEAQSIHANLIHFPKELVATRRIRPRISSPDELPEEEQLGQLSIFEVDPNSIAIGPTASVAQDAAQAPSWCGPGWTNIDLEADRPRMKEFDGGPPAVDTSIHVAPVELRCMAGLIDFALIIGLVCAAAAGVAGHLPHQVSAKVAEFGGIAAFVVTALLYHVFFLLVAKSTPGMMYSGIALCTFDDEHPTPQELRGRLRSMLVSLLPVGLGMAWAIFDEDHLSWHDRVSRTYLRRC